MTTPNEARSSRDFYYYGLGAFVGFCLGVIVTSIVVAIKNGVFS